jgi:spore coat protein H
MLVLLAAALVWQWTRRDAEPPPPPANPARAARPVPGAAIFKRPTLLAFKLELSSDAMDELRRAPRDYVSATVTIDGLVFTNVGVHLKGALGSFRRLDDRPALTLSFSKFAEDRRWHGLRKIHLNNSVQDRSYMNEYLGSELFRAVNVPTPRVAFATVQLNDRKLGLYVLKEAFTQDFLACFFDQTDGNLYEGELQKDITAALGRDCGKGVADRSDLKALAEAAGEGDPAQRWERLQRVLDLDRFVSYLALEVMLADWDGYPLAPNNYRVYFNPTNDLAVFLPHGIDQLFQRAEMQVFPYFRGSVARAVFETPQGRQRYEERFQMIFTNHFRLEGMTNTMARLADLLRPVQPDIDDTARRLRGQIASRIAFLERQPLLEAHLPRPASGVRATPWPQAPGGAVASKPGQTRLAEQPLIRLADWRKDAKGEATLEQVESDGRRVLQIVARGSTTAAWQSTVRLKAGRYRFEGRARATGVEALSDAVGEGAGLRIAGTTLPRLNKLTGTTRWMLLAYEFEVAERERDVTCVCELRARKGQVQFELSSLRLIPQGR